MSRKPNQEKIKKILMERGYSGGKAPKGHEVHHVKTRAEGGQETPKNIRVIPEGKHKTIHKNRRKQGKI